MPTRPNRHPIGVTIRMDIVNITLIGSRRLTHGTGITRRRVFLLWHHRWRLVRHTSSGVDRRSLLVTTRPLVRRRPTLQINVKIYFRVFLRPRHILLRSSVNLIRFNRTINRLSKILRPVQLLFNPYRRPPGSTINNNLDKRTGRSTTLTTILNWGLYHTRHNLHLTRTRLYFRGRRPQFLNLTSDFRRNPLSFIKQRTRTFHGHPQFHRVQLRLPQENRIRHFPHPVSAKKVRNVTTRLFRESRQGMSNVTNSPIHRGRRANRRSLDQSNRLQRLIRTKGTTFLRNMIGRFSPTTLPRFLFPLKPVIKFPTTSFILVPRLIGRVLPNL